MLVIQAPGRVLNSTIDQGVIDRAKAKDPVAAASEWDASFRSDISRFLQDKDIDEATVAGRRMVG